MKLKLMAFAFILAFAITSFGALGVSGASADGPDLIIEEAGITVEGPNDACDGAVTAFTAIGGAGVEIDNLDADLSDCF